MICKKCNHKLPDDSEFCQYCGTKIESVEATPKNALDAMLQFQAAATVDAMQANSASQPDNEEQDDFGLVPQKPIYTLALKSVIGEEEYLDKLRTADGQKIRYTRRGSMSVDGIHGMIDIYDTFLPDGQLYKTIYINMYGATASTSVPKGFLNLCARVQEKNSMSHETKQVQPTKQSNKFMNLLIGKKKLIIICTVICASLFIAFAYPCIALDTYRDGMADHYFDTVEENGALVISGCGEKSCPYCNESFVISYDYGLLSIPAYEYILDMIKILAPLTTFSGFFALVGTTLLIIIHFYERRMAVKFSSTEKNNT